MIALQKALTEISLLSPQSGQDFLSAWQRWTFSKDDILLQENVVSDYLYFVERGVVRIYYHKNGKEVTEWLTTDGNFFVSIVSFFERTPSRLIIHIPEPSIIYGIHHNDLMSLADKYHDVEKLLRKMLTTSLILSQYRMDSIQFESAAQRYENLLKHSPEIIRRVPLSYIASFLGITLETLSRIRSNKK